MLANAPDLAHARSFRSESVRALSPGRRRAERATRLPGAAPRHARAGSRRWRPSRAALEAPAGLGLRRETSWWREARGGFWLSGKCEQRDRRAPYRHRAPRPVAQPAGPALPAGRRMEPGERAGRATWGGRCASQDGEDRGKERRGEAGRRRPRPTPTHATERVSERGVVTSAANPTLR